MDKKLKQIYKNISGHLFLFGAIFFTVTGQMLFKIKAENIAEIPESLIYRFINFIKLLANPYIFFGLTSAFLASFLWFTTLTKLDISYAYPFMSLSYVLVLFFASIFFNEPIGFYRILGTVFIVIGLYFIARG